MIPEFAAGLALGVWIYLLAGRGRFWQIREAPLPPRADTEPFRSVVAIVPARDEAATVGRAIQSLAGQDYGGPFQIVLVDDASSDGTAAVARQAAERIGAGDRLTVVTARPLEIGWTGKLWAVSEGLRQAEPLHADYFLLTDADIVHSLDNISMLVARAESAGWDLVSLMVRLECRSLAERALVPAFVFFFFLLYPPAWVARENRKTAAAAGGCILIRKEVLYRLDGIQAVRSELIDDCALARAVKGAGGKVWLGITSSTHSIRSYGWSEIEQMIARTAFTQLRHSVLLLAATCLGMALTYFVPPLLLFFGNACAAALGGRACVLMAIALVPTLRFYGRSLFWAPLVPLIAAFYVAATLDSALRYWRGRGGVWKGRVQDLQE